MTFLRPTKSLTRLAAGFALAATIATSPVPLAAQDSVSEARLRKLEAEIRALQRKVFPGGDGRFFEPQISSAGNTTQATNQQPTTTAVTDILARLDALETQIQRLTAMSEENANAVTRMESRLALLEASPGAGEGLADTVEVPEPSVTDSNLSAMSGGATSESGDAGNSASQASRPEASGPSAARLAAVQEIAKPQTDDPADDEYSYGYRLWNAGFYPEARQQLSKFVEQYPNHWRATYGRNLLGRAFLDDGMPEEAARWFLRNYQADRTAPRAPDSLLFLAEAMIAMNDTRRACIALAEFGETYPAVASGRLADRYQSNLRKVSCEN